MIKLIPNWLFTDKMIRKFFTSLYADENILYFNEDSGNVITFCNEVGILNINLNNINLDNNFDKDDPNSIILIRGLAWHMKFTTRKALKKIHEELMPIG